MDFRFTFESKKQVKNTSKLWNGNGDSEVSGVFLSNNSLLFFLLFSGVIFTTTVNYFSISPIQLHKTKMKLTFFFLLAFGQTLKIFESLNQTFEQMQLFLNSYSQKETSDLDYSAMVNDVLEKKQDEIVAIIKIVESESDDFLGFILTKVDQILTGLFFSITLFALILNFL